MQRGPDLFLLWPPNVRVLFFSILIRIPLFTSANAMQRVHANSQTQLANSQYKCIISKTKIASDSTVPFIQSRKFSTGKSTGAAQMQIAELYISCILLFTKSDRSHVWLWRAKGRANAEVTWVMSRFYKGVRSHYKTPCKVSREVSKIALWFAILCAKFSVEFGTVARQLSP